MIVYFTSYNSLHTSQQCFGLAFCDLGTQLQKICTSIISCDSKNHSTRETTRSGSKKNFIVSFRVPNGVLFPQTELSIGMSMTPLKMTSCWSFEKKNKLHGVEFYFVGDGENGKGVCLTYANISQKTCRYKVVWFPSPPSIPRHQRCKTSRWHPSAQFDSKSHVPLDPPGHGQF